MANLRGKGAFEDVSLIVKLPAKGTLPGKDSKQSARFLEIQVDQSLKNPAKVASGESKADSNPYLVSYNKTNPQTNSAYTSHRDKYWESQFESIEKAAGDKAVTLDNGDKLYGITASLTKNAHGNLIVDTNKSMGPTKNPRFGANVLDKQAAVTKAAKEVRAKEREADKQADAPEATAEAQEPTAEQPEV